MNDEEKTYRRNQLRRRLHILMTDFFVFLCLLLPTLASVFLAFARPSFLWVAWVVGTSPLTLYYGYMWRKGLNEYRYALDQLEYGG